jgi:hypothetical protein
VAFTTIAMFAAGIAMFVLQTVELAAFASGEQLCTDSAMHPWNS